MQSLPIEILTEIMTYCNVLDSLHLLVALRHKKTIEFFSAFAHQMIHGWREDYTFERVSKYWRFVLGVTIGWDVYKNQMISQDGHTIKTVLLGRMFYFETIVKQYLYQNQIRSREIW